MNPLKQRKKTIRKLVLPTYVVEEEVGEGGTNHMSRVVKERQVEVAQHVLGLTEELKEYAVSQASKVLKTHMEMKTKSGASDAHRLEVGALESGNLAQSSPSKPIDIYSSSDSNDEFTLYQRYSTLRKAKTPSSSTLPKPDYVS